MASRWYKGELGKGEKWLVGVNGKSMDKQIEKLKEELKKELKRKDNMGADNYTIPDRRGLPIERTRKIVTRKSSLYKFDRNVKKSSAQEDEK